MNNLSIYNLSNSGKYLIEANAGSGKTWQIITNYCWLIATREDIQVENIVITTFTVAATNELKQRIFERLQSFKFAIINQNNQLLNLPEKYWQKLLADQETTKQRINNALAHIEQVRIYTIHGFMQNLLAQNAFYAKLPIDFEVIDENEEGKLWSLAIDYAWRQALFTDELDSQYGIKDNLIKQHKNNIFLKDYFYKKYPTIQALKTGLEIAHNNDNLEIDLPKSINKIDLLALYSSCKAWAQKIEDSQEDIVQNCISLDQRRYKQEKVEKALFEIINYFKQAAEFLLGKRVEPKISKAIGLFYPNKIEENITKKAINENWQPLVIFREYENFIVKINQKIKLISEHFEFLVFKFAFESANSFYCELLAKKHKISFNQIINFSYRLVSDNERSKNVISEFTKNTKVLLIDEFQDTDKQQWEIYKKLHANKILLVAVGDPKQSIYSFRTADIYNYFQAKKEMTDCLVLSENYRATAKVVSAVNNLFDVENSFKNDDLIYQRVTAKKEFADHQIDDNKPYKLLLLNQSLTTNPDRLNAATDDMIARIFKIKDKKPNAKIAVIVNYNRQCEDIVNKLGINNLPALTTSERYSGKAILSAFIHLLLAIDNLRIAIKNRSSKDELVDFMIINQKEISNLLFSPLWIDINNDWIFWKLIIESKSEFADKDKLLIVKIKNQLNILANIWEKSGIYALTKYLEKNGLAKKLIHLNWDIRDLATLKQTSLFVSSKTQNLQEQILLIKKIINNQISVEQNLAEENQSVDNQELISNNPIEVCTIFKAKGRQWDYVFCPTAWQNVKPPNRDIQKYYQPKNQNHQQGNWRINIFTIKDELINKNINQNNQAEDLRKFYVMLTRSIYGTYVYWQTAAAKESDNENDQEKPAPTFLINQLLGKIENQKTPDWEVVEVESNTQIYPKNSIEPEEVKYLPYQHEPIMLKGKTSHSYSSISKLFNKNQPPADLNRIPDSIFQNHDQEVENESAFEEENQNSNQFFGLDFGLAVHSLIDQVIKTKADNSNYDFQELISDSIDKKFLLEKNNQDYDRLKVTLESFIDNAVCKPLPKEIFSQDNIKLIDCQIKNIQTEWNFCISWNQINITKWQRFLHQLKIITNLSKNSVYLPEMGYINGSIDTLLYIPQNQKYYVIDYKTNKLELKDYKKSSIKSSIEKLIAEHYYKFQAALYLLAVHRYLQANLENYQADNYLGGVAFNFLRLANENISSYYYFSKDDLALDLLTEVFE